MEESLMLLKEKFHLKDTDAGQYSPLVLAYLGDAAYEILIRTIVVSEGNMQVNKLHKKSSALVKAAALPYPGVWSVRARSLSIVFGTPKNLVG